MKSWKVVKQKENEQKKIEAPKKCNKFKCMAILMGVLAVIYAGIVSGTFSTFGKKLYASSAMKPVVTNEYFVLIKRLVELVVVRIQVLLLEALVISRLIMGKVCCGVSAISNKIPGVEKAKASLGNCQYCQSTFGALLKIGSRVKDLLCSLHSKIKELKKKE